MKKDNFKKDTSIFRKERNTIQENSFIKHCKRNDYDIDEQKELLLHIAKKDLLNANEIFRKSEPQIANEALRDFEEVFASEDWWEFKNKFNDLQKTDRIYTICQWAAHLPINYEYINKLNTKNELVESKINSPASIRKFLNKIPIISLYNSRFNAFSVEETTLLGLPCVGIEELLVTSVDKFINVVMNIVIKLEPNGNVSPPKPEDWHTMGTDPRFQEALEKIIKFILGDTRTILLHKNLLLSEKSNLRILHLAMTQGGIDFVWYHEYAHLLMGHFRIGASHKIEYEADAFAWKILKKNYQNIGGATFWYMLGGLITLIIISIIEGVDRMGDSPSHPFASSRISRLIKLCDNHVSQELYIYLKGIMATCRPTLFNAWNLHANS